MEPRNSSIFALLGASALVLALAVGGCNPNRTPNVPGGVSDEDRPATTQNPYGQSNGDAHGMLQKQQPGAVSSPTVGSGSGNDVSNATTRTQNNAERESGGANNADPRGSGVNNPDKMHQPATGSPSQSGDRFSGGH